MDEAVSTDFFHLLEKFLSVMLLIKYSGKKICSLVGDSSAKSNNKRSIFVSWFNNISKYYVDKRY